MSRGVWLTVAAATALVLLLTGGLHPVARVWTAILMAPLPALMLFQAAQLRDMDELPRTAAYVSSIVSLWVLLALTLAFAHLASLQLPALETMSGHYTILLVGVLTAACIGVLFLFFHLGADETPVLRALLPQTRAEKLLFVAVSVTAGICEEWVFRGFLQAALTTATHSPWLALALASGTFGIVHAYQSGTGAARAALIGLILGVPVVLGWGLLPSMAAHALVDVLSGVFLARRLLR